jgi:membrane fusion protein (multidrug efflux system)
VAKDTLCQVDRTDQFDLDFAKMVPPMTAPKPAIALRDVSRDDHTVAAPAAPTEAAPAEASAAPSPSPVETASKPRRKRPNLVLPVILLAIFGGAGWYGYDWWTDGRFLVSTDDAYIQGDIAIISPKVSGYVEKVNVVENQQVQAGDPLVTLDGGDYQLAVSRAETAIEAARLAVNRIDAQIVGAEAALKQAEAQQGALAAAVRGAEITEKRATGLAAKSVGTAADVDNARVALEQARANLVAGEAAVSSAKANIGLLQAQRHEAVNTIHAL